MPLEPRPNMAMSRTPGSVRQAGAGMPRWLCLGQMVVQAGVAAVMWRSFHQWPPEGVLGGFRLLTAFLAVCVVTLYALMLVSRLRHSAEADELGVSRRKLFWRKTIPWSQVAGYRVERNKRGYARRCVICGEGGEELITLSLSETPVAERERFLAFVEASWASRGPAELVAASAPEGTGLEIEAASAPAGRGTEPEAAPSPPRDRAPA